MAIWQDTPENVIVSVTTLVAVDGTGLGLGDGAGFVVEVSVEVVDSSVVPMLCAAPAASSAIVAVVNINVCLTAR